MLLALPFGRSFKYQTSRPSHHNSSQGFDIVSEELGGGDARMGTTTPEQAGGILVFPQPGINTGPPWINRVALTPSTKMQLAAMLDHLSDTRATMELVIWVWTVSGVVPSVFGLRRQLKNAKSRAGSIKPGSTGPRIWTGLLLLSQFCGFFLPQLVYWTATGYNGFRQPEWMTEHALPSPPYVLGVDGMVVGRAVGLMAMLAGKALAGTAMKALGDQYSPIGVSALFFRG